MDDGPKPYVHQCQCPMSVSVPKTMSVSVPNVDQINSNHHKIVGRVDHLLSAARTPGRLEVPAVVRREVSVQRDEIRLA